MLANARKSISKNYLTTNGNGGHSTLIQNINSNNYVFMNEENKSIVDLDQGS